MLILSHAVYFFEKYWSKQSGNKDGDMSFGDMVAW